MITLLQEMTTLCAGLNGYALGAMFAALPIMTALSLFNKRMFG